MRCLPAKAAVRLYLASTSPARLALLRQIGIEPVVVPPLVDEEAEVARAEAETGPLAPGAMVQLLARLKAEAIAGSEVDGQPIDGFILGGDSAFEFEGVAYGKPHRPEVARDRWLAQRGGSGVLHSGHWIVDHRGGVRRDGAGRVDEARLTFADDITDAEIDAYIASGEPLLVAGAFTIDGLAAPFIRSIEGAPSAVVGMSLPVVRDLLRGFGADWTSFWNR